MRYNFSLTKKRTAPVQLPVVFIKYLLHKISTATQAPYSSITCFGNSLHEELVKRAYIFINRVLTTSSIKFSRADRRKFHLRIISPNAFGRRCFEQAVTNHGAEFRPRINTKTLVIPPREPRVNGAIRQIYNAASSKRIHRGNSLNKSELGWAMFNRISVTVARIQNPAVRTREMAFSVPLNRPSYYAEHDRCNE